jgi:hypothetical protein
MTQVHKPRARATRISRNTGSIKELMEGIDDRKIAERPSPSRHKQVSIV